MRLAEFSIRPVRRAASLTEGELKQVKAAAERAERLEASAKANAHFDDLMLGAPSVTGWGSGDPGAAFIASEGYR